MRNDLFTQVLDFSYVQIIKVPGEGFKGYELSFGSADPRASVL